MKKYHTLSKVFLLLFSTAFLIVLLSVAYYFVVRLPQIKETERITKATTDYYDCLEQTDAAADKQRAEYCDQLNGQYKDCLKGSSTSFCNDLWGRSGTDLMSCRMGPRQLDLANELYKGGQEGCHNKYPEIPIRKERYFANLDGKIITEKLIRE